MKKHPCAHKMCFFVTIQRLVTLVTFSRDFLTWTLLLSQEDLKKLFCFTSRFRKKTKYVYYRLLDGLQEFSRLYQLRFGKIPLEPLKNG